MRTLLFLVVFSILLSLLSRNSAEARWATEEDATAVVNLVKWDYLVRKDGSFQITVEREVEILKEAARTERGLTRLDYDAALATIEILKAETVNGDKHIPVEAGDIEIKPLASSGPGFNVTNQVTIAYPDVNIGSKLYLKYIKNFKSSMVPGMFWEHMILSEEWIKKLEATVESELPLFTEFHDPDHYLATTVKPKKVTFKLRKPYYRRILQEDYPLFEPKSYIWIALTTVKSWKEIPAPTVNAYEAELARALPPKFNEILTQARKEKSDIDRMNRVTSLLADRVRYVGDWRAVDSGFHPRNLELIAKSGYGDCKDFSVTTGAILRQLGFETHAAWIWRGRHATFSPLKAAAFDVNHAIVWAKKDGKEYWIDPTNLTSYAQGIYADIAERPAIVLDPTGPYEKDTPARSAEEGRVRIIGDLDVSKNDAIKAKGTLALLGSAAVAWAGSGLSATKQSLDHSLIRWVANGDNLVSWDVGRYDLTARTVRDFTVDYKTEEVWRPVRTTAGIGYLVPAPFYTGYFRFRREQRVSGARFDDPLAIQRTLRLRGRAARLDKDIRCEGNSEYAAFARQVHREDDAIVIEDEIVLKKPGISNDVIRSKAFGDFQNQILSCLQESVIIFE